MADPYDRNADEKNNPFGGDSKSNADKPAENAAGGDDNFYKSSELEKKEAGAAEAAEQAKADDGGLYDESKTVGGDVAKPPSLRKRWKKYAVGGGIAVTLGGGR